MLADQRRVHAACAGGLSQTTRASDIEYVELLLDTCGTESHIHIGRFGSQAHRQSCHIADLQFSRQPPAQQTAHPIREMILFILDSSYRGLPAFVLLFATL